MPFSRFHCATSVWWKTHRVLVPLLERPIDFLRPRLGRRNETRGDHLLSPWFGLPNAHLDQQRIETLLDVRNVPLFDPHTGKVRHGLLMIAADLVLHPARRVVRYHCVEVTDTVIDTSDGGGDADHWPGVPVPVPAVGFVRNRTKPLGTGAFIGDLIADFRARSRKSANPGEQIPFVFGLESAHVDPVCRHGVILESGHRHT